ncbi:hypothetical protein MJG53_004103 [Ovis ammon polii x Ovis aries]|uniref:Uncharacterized protein n=1 Tax=Ovis ammon polii x Ovis aries TaxID=2918886 RepID=A0ACB9V9C7_9CETA|nr:hypothetical protein MJG53_004103 [Ovis ammon polii x Ovis aries]
MLQGNSTSEESVEEGRSGKDLRKKCLAIISPVTPAKLCSCILIIFILLALNVVMLSALVAESKNWTFSQTSCTKMEAVLAQFEMEEELGGFMQNMHFHVFTGESKHSSYVPSEMSDASHATGTYSATYHEGSIQVPIPCAVVNVVFITTLIIALVALSDDWIGHKGKCYLISKKTKNWTLAQNFCSKHDATLAVIDSKEDMEVCKNIGFFLIYAMAEEIVYADIKRTPSEHSSSLQRSDSHHHGIFLKVGCAMIVILLVIAIVLSMLVIQFKSARQTEVDNEPKKKYCTEQVPFNSSTVYTSCPSKDWKLHGGKCYWVAEHGNKKSWNESKNDCVMKESHLMVVRDFSDMLPTFVMSGANTFSVFAQSLPALPQG